MDGGLRPEHSLEVEHSRLGERPISESPMAWVWAGDPLKVQKGSGQQLWELSGQVWLPRGASVTQVVAEVNL